nr:hypothetical protein [uncultured Psychroserpens sp.]
MKNFVASVFKMLMVLMTLSVYGQELPEVIPPSPTVANLMQFEEVPVSHYTGQPNISIPLYSKALNNGIGINIALSYNTQGIKINNRSSWVGTGWSLNAGGVISRTVRGLPDEKRDGFGSPLNGTGVFHNSDFWNYNSTNPSIDQQEFLWKASGDPDDLYDYQLDLFQFNFLGITGRFVIVKDFTDVNIPLKAELLTKNQAIAIELDYDLSTYELHGFILTDTKGNKYFFDVQENMTSETVTAITKFNGDPGTSSSTMQNRSAWHLSKIETSNAQTLATFNYTSVYEEFKNSISYSNYEVVDRPSHYNALIANSYNSGIMNPKSTKSIVTTYGNTKKLTNIYFRDDQLPSVVFDFLTTTHPESELGKGAILKKIDIKKQDNSVLKTFDFSHDDTNNDRLWLEKITETAGGISQDYVLDYTDKNSLPVFDSSSDNWGYNDGAGGIANNTCYRSNFDKEAIKKGLLKKITYPTGGVKEFIFEHNTITYQSKIQLGSTSPPQGNDDNFAIALPDDFYQEHNPDNWVAGGDISYTFDSTDNVPAGSTNYETLIINHTQEVVYKRGTYSITYGTCNSSSNKSEDVLFDSYLKITSADPNNNYENTIRLDKEEVHFELDAGTYEIRYYSFFTPSCLYLDFGVCFNVKDYESNISRFVYGGGVRIKDIIFKDKVTDVTPARKISFSYTEATDTTNSKSSGTVDGDILGLSKSYSQIYKRYLFTTADNQVSSFLPQTLEYAVEIKAPNVELSQGAYVGYKTVNVSEENNGFTRYTFTSAQDYANATNVFSFPYAPAAHIDYKRGLLLKKQVFKHNTTPYTPGTEPPGKLSEVVNTYDFIDADIAPTFRLYNESSCEFKQFYSDYANWVTASPEASLIPKDTNDQPCYFGNGVCTNVPFASITDNVKSGWAQLTQTVTKEYFNVDQSSPPYIESRQTFLYNTQNFQISQTDNYYDESGIEQHIQTKYYYPVGAALTGGNSTVIRDQLKDLNKINEVLETETYKNTVKLSETHNMFHLFSPNQIFPQTIKVAAGGNTPEARIQFIKYDDYGNLLEVSKEDGISISYIWGYNEMYPVAKLIDVTYSEIVTTLGAFDLGNGGLTSTQIEELMDDYPDTQISIYEYDPMVGITKMTDARGYTMTYYYDAFNRLKEIRDHENNILSQNEYNYKNQY